MNTTEEKKSEDQTIPEVNTKRVPDDKLEGVSGGMVPGMGSGMVSCVVTERQHPPRKNNI